MKKRTSMWVGRRHEETNHEIPTREYDEQGLHTSRSPEAFSHKARWPVATSGWKISYWILTKPFPHTLPLTVLNFPSASSVQITSPPRGCRNPPGKEKSWALFSSTRRGALLEDSLLRSAQGAGPPRTGVMTHQAVRPPHSISSEWNENQLGWLMAPSLGRITVKGNRDLLSIRQHMSFF